MICLSNYNATYEKTDDPCRFRGKNDGLIRLRSVPKNAQSYDFKVIGTTTRWPLAGSEKLNLFTTLQIKTRAFLP